MATLFWTFPVLMLAAIVIGWGAELTAVHLSAGIALAVLAWLQTSPEFAVEATIAWSRDSHLALANLTGSLRLLLGLGLPMVFFIHWYSKRRRGAKIKDVVLPEAFAVEAAGLAIPVVYFLIIYAKGTWGPIDGVILCAFYGFYFWLLNRERILPGGDVEEPEEEDEPWVVRKVLHFSKGGQYAAIAAMFVFGAAALWVTVHPFIESLKVAAARLGVSEFVFIQWIAPIASEFPEKVTAFNWARKPGKKVAMAVVNILSSVTSQWTLLAGLVPIIFSISAGELFTITFDDFQKQELMLTIAQSAITVVMLADLRISMFEMTVFFALWLVQFVVPSSRAFLAPVYGAWFVIESIRLIMHPERCVAWKRVRRLIFGTSTAS